MIPTVKDALKSDVTYPLPDVFYEKTLILRGLNGSDSFTKEIGVSESYRLAYADCLVRHAVIVSRSEAEISIGGISDPDILLSMANKIYSQYGEEEVQIDPVPTATYIGETWMED